MGALSLPTLPGDTLPSLPGLSQVGEAVSSAAATVATQVGSSAVDAAVFAATGTLPGTFLKNMTTANIVAIVLGLILIGGGILMFKNVQEGIGMTAKLAV